MTEASNGEGISGHMDSTVPISLKLLATHLGVGAVIGKHGGSITEIQVASGAKIQISGPNEVFAGTTERIMHISGEMLKVRSFRMFAERLFNIPVLRCRSVGRVGMRVRLKASGFVAYHFLGCCTILYMACPF